MPAPMRSCDVIRSIAENSLRHLARGLGHLLKFEEQLRLRPCTHRKHPIWLQIWTSIGRTEPVWKSVHRHRSWIRAWACGNRHKCG